jgi:hypothetical protein
MSATTEFDLDHSTENGDVYDAVEACDDLTQKLSRLRRLHVMTEGDYLASRDIVDEVRHIVETHLDERPYHRS